MENHLDEESKLASWNLISQFLQKSYKNFKTPPISLDATLHSWRRQCFKNSPNIRAKFPLKSENCGSTGMRSRICTNCCSEIKNVLPLNSWERRCCKEYMYIKLTCKWSNASGEHEKLYFGPVLDTKLRQWCRNFQHATKTETAVGNAKRYL